MGQRLVDKFSPRRLVKEAKVINAEGYVAEAYQADDGELNIRPLRADSVSPKLLEDPNYKDGRAARFADQSDASHSNIEDSVVIDYWGSTEGRSLGYAVVGCGVLFEVAIGWLLFHQLKQQQGNLEKLAADPEAVKQELVAQNLKDCVDLVADNLQSDTADTHVTAFDIAAQDFACRTDSHILVESYKQRAEDLIQSDDGLGVLSVAATCVMTASYLLDRYVTRAARTKREIGTMNFRLMKSVKPTVDLS